MIAMYTDLENFVAAVEQLKTLRAENKVRFHVSSQGDINLAFDPSAANAAPPAGGGLYMDLRDAIGAVGAGASLDEFKARRGEPRPPIFPEPESPDVAEAKYAQVRPFGDELRPRVLLRSTSRAPILVAHDWEVVTRRADSITETNKYMVSYGVFRFTYERSLAVASNIEQEAVAINLDLQDIEELIEDLEALRSSLRAHPMELANDGGAGT